MKKIKFDFWTFLLGFITALGAPGVINTVSDAVSSDEIVYEQSFDDFVYSTEEYREALGLPGGHDYDGNKYLVTVTLSVQRQLGGDGLPQYNFLDETDFSFILFTKKDPNEAYLMIDKAWFHPKFKKLDGDFTGVRAIGLLSD